MLNRNDNLNICLTEIRSIIDLERIIMRIVFCIYDDINYEARSQEEIECLIGMGEVSIVTIAPLHNHKYADLYVKTTSRNYLRFVLTSYSMIIEQKPDVVFLHDDYCAILIPFIRRVIPKARIIYDMSELYLGGIVKGLKGWISNLIFHGNEKKYLRKVDCVISANQERADIARGYFSLSERPIVFENIHRIDEEYDLNECEELFGELFLSKKYTIIYAGGLLHAKERGTYELLSQMKELGPNFQIIVAGKSRENDKRFNSILEANHPINNIHYVGMLTRDKLRYLFQRSDINVVTFNQDTINNIFCASGKMYEGLFEGIPLLVSDNPPLRSKCTEYGIGCIVEKDNYVEAIKRASEQKDSLEVAVSTFVRSIDYSTRIDKLRRNIIERIVDESNAKL